MKRVIPLLDRVLVQRVKAMEKTKTGIYIPEKSQDVLNEGVVKAVGNGKEGKKVELKEGDRVLLPPFGGNNVKLGEEEYIIFKEADILAKLE